MRLSDVIKHPILFLKVKFWGLKRFLSHHWLDHFWKAVAVSPLVGEGYGKYSIEFECKKVNGKLTHSGYFKFSKIEGNC